MRFTRKKQRKEAPSPYVWKNGLYLRMDKPPFRRTPAEAAQLAAHHPASQAGKTSAASSKKKAAQPKPKKDLKAAKPKKPKNQKK